MNRYTDPIYETYQMYLYNHNETTKELLLDPNNNEKKRAYLSSHQQLQQSFRRLDDNQRAFIPPNILETSRFDKY